MYTSAEFIQIGEHFTLYWYGVLVLISFFLFTIITHRVIAWNKNLGLDQCQLKMVLILLIWSVQIGGRLGQILFYELPFGGVESWQLISRQGFSFHGALFLSLLVIVGWHRAKRLPFFALTDPLAIAVPVILVLGRLGNFINREVYGLPTSLPWGVIILSHENLGRHPVQLYEACGYLFLLIGQLYLAKRYSELIGSGRFLATFLIGYALVRLPLEFFKAEQYFLLGITVGQWLTLPMVVLGVLVYLRSRVSLGAGDGALSSRRAGELE